jgi:hypothetical protein
MSERIIQTAAKERAVSIIRQANNVVTKIQSGENTPKTYVVHKNGEGHFSVRVDSAPTKKP